MSAKIRKTFENFEKALAALAESVAVPPVENRDYAGIIQSFEFTYELCWKALKLILESNGIEAPFPRMVFEEAFKANLLDGNEIWKDIIEARNLTTHAYNQELARKMYPAIKDRFLPAFQRTAVKMAPFASAGHA
jgi:nucleotidyltransferase substrate binding protein (TIGR01987 family)